MQTVVSSAEAKLKEFEQAKAPDGQSLYPHFEAVRQDMAALMMTATQAGQVLDLPSAYQRAVWSRDDLRDSMLKAQNGEAVPGRFRCKPGISRAGEGCTLSALGECSGGRRRGGRERADEGDAPEGLPGVAEHPLRNMARGPRSNELWRPRTRTSRKSSRPR